jgi:hypothetical protein
MKLKKRLLVFVSFFVIAFVFWRLRVLTRYSDGQLPFLRAVTGLTFHHFHYGLIFILIAALLLIFYRRNSFSIGLMGFGLGTSLDSFISRLFSFSSVRVREISAYDSSFIATFIMFLDIILLTFVFYYFKERKI